MGRCKASQQICRNMTEKPFTGPNSILPIKHKNLRAPWQPYNEETVFLVVGISQILLWEGNRQVFSAHLHNGQRWRGNILRKLLFQSQRAFVGRRLVIRLDWIYDSPESSTTLSISSSSNIINNIANIEQYHCHQCLKSKGRKGRWLSWIIKNIVNINIEQYHHRAISTLSNIIVVNVWKAKSVQWCSPFEFMAGLPPRRKPLAWNQKLATSSTSTKQKPDHQDHALKNDDNQQGEDD